MNEQKKGRPDRPLKRVVIREEFVSLVNAYCHEPSKKRVSTPYITAILLAQLLYWETKCRDYDSFRTEEYNRLEQMERFSHGREPDATPVQPPVLTHGWIYKSAQELSEETMLGLSDATILTHLRRLLSIGVLEKRNNPNYHWDRRLQYRVNTIRLRQLLFAIGYNLEGWPILPEGYRLADSVAPPFSKTEDAFLKFKNASSETKNAFLKTKNQSLPNQKSNHDDLKIKPSDIKNRTITDQRAISYTTADTTTDTTTDITAEREAAENEIVTTTTPVNPSASSSPVTETTWDALAASPQGKDLITIYECSVHPIKEQAERNALMAMMKEHGSARVQVALWRAQTLGRQDLLPCMRDFLAFWKDLERRSRNNRTTTNGNDGSRRADSSAADRPLSQAEQNELRLLEIRERACNGHYTEADAREAEHLYC